MNRGTKFINDIFIYAIGNLGSKLITFLLVPLYTYFISPEDFGYYDIVLNLTFLAMGFITFQLRDGTFRFLLDNEEEHIRKSVVSFSYKLLTQSSLVVLLAGIVFSFFYEIRDWGWIIAFVITLSLYEVEIQIARGLGQNKQFVLAGILTAFQIALYSLVFVAWLRMGIGGIFCSNILARVVTMVIVEIRTRIFKRYFFMGFKDKALNKALLKYSLPLLPNAVCWWLLGSSSRLYIEHFLGLEANGIFAVAMKFSTILETFSVIVYQAWQETAIKQYEAPDRGKFFSRIFNTYSYILTVLALVFSFVLKLNYSWLVDDRYADSLQYLYPLFISVVCFALAAFYDLGYQCSKRTVRNLPGIIITTVLNLVMNYFFIRIWGIWGIVLSSILSYLFLLAFRIIDTWKFFPVKVSMEILYPILALIIGGIVFYEVDSAIWQIGYVLAIIIIAYYVQPKEVKVELQMKLKAFQNKLQGR
ncbi:MAG TPA: lipopolysaccharide biosynthesis protein [Candidatus Barnesiella excrementigallinarum]|nr:lipopolysaccharide biosynthesis protein [Candidatus Barnesiella excrementigallinarum]